jgi:hypothetical protein
MGAVNFAALVLAHHLSLHRHKADGGERNRIRTNAIASVSAILRTPGMRRPGPAISAEVEDDASLEMDCNDLRKTDAQAWSALVRSAARPVGSDCATVPKRMPIGGCGTKGRREGGTEGRRDGGTGVGRRVPPSRRLVVAVEVASRPEQAERSSGSSGKTPSPQTDDFPTQFSASSRARWARRSRRREWQKNDWQKNGKRRAYPAARDSRSLHFSAIHLSAFPPSLRP